MVMVDRIAACSSAIECSGAGRGTRRTVAFALAALGLLGACGQKGPLAARRRRRRRPAPRRSPPRRPRRGDAPARRARTSPTAATRFTSRAAPLSELARRFGTPLYVYSRAAMRDALAPLPARAGRPRPPDLLRDEGQLEPGGAADVRATPAAASTSSPAASSSACSRPAATRRGSCSPASARRAPRCAGRSTPACCCFNVESDRRARRCCRQVAAARGRARAGQPARQPGRRRQTHPYISTGLRGQQVRHRPRARRWPRTAAPRALPGIEVVGIDCHIGSQITEIAPYLDALDRLLDLVEARRGAKASPIAPPRPRRRPRHHLHRRDAADGRRAGRAPARAHRRARPRPPQAPVRARPLAGRQCRRAAQRGAVR